MESGVIFSKPLWVESDGEFLHALWIYFPAEHKREHFTLGPFICVRSTANIAQVAKILHHKKENTPFLSLPFLFGCFSTCKAESERVQFLNRPIALKSSQEGIQVVCNQNGKLLVKKSYFKRKVSSYHRSRNVVYYHFLQIFILVCLFHYCKEYYISKSSSHIR